MDSPLDKVESPQIKLSVADRSSTTLTMYADLGSLEFRIRVVGWRENHQSRLPSPCNCEPLNPKELHHPRLFGWGAVLRLCLSVTAVGTSERRDWVL